MKFFEQENRLGVDDCAQNAKEYQNTSINDYYLWNTYHMKCDSSKEDELDRFAANNNNLHFRNGYGYTTACHVDGDSELRVNGKITHEKAKTQLFTRFYQANPDLSKGVGVPNLESRLVQGDNTSQYKVCGNKLAEEDFQRFTPLLPCLKDTIQNPNHIVLPFKRGGDNSRTLMRDSNSLKKCGFKNDWQQKH